MRKPMWILSLAFLTLGPLSFRDAGAPTVSAQTSATAPPTGEPPAELKPGVSVVRDIQGGDEHLYRISLKAGTFLRIGVEQHDADVIILPVDPADKELPPCDLEDEGTESYFLTTEADGEYTVVVGLEKGPPGRYEIAVAELRPATESDRRRTAAFLALLEGRQLANRPNLAEAQKQALAKYRTALEGWRSVGDRRREAETLDAVAQSLDLLDDVRQARETFEQALDLWKRLGDERNETYTLAHLALLLQKTGEPRKALDIYRRIRPNLTTWGSLKTQANFLNNFANLVRDLGEYGQAVEAYSRALRIYERLGNKKRIAGLWVNLASVYFDQGDYQQTGEAYRRALPVLQSVSDMAGETFALNGLGRLAFTLGNYQEALEYYRRTLDVSRAQGSRGSVAPTLNNIGKVYVELGEPRRAAELFEEAIRLSREIGDAYGEGYALTNLGLLRLRSGEIDQAVEFFNQAMTIRRTVGDRKGEAATLAALGAAFFKGREFDKARDTFAKSLELSEAVGYRSGRAEALYGLAGVERDAGNLDLARTKIAQAVEIVETIRASLIAQEHRTSYFAVSRDHYRLYIDILMRLDRERPTDGWGERALEIAERARARSLIDLLSEAKIDPNRTSDPTLADSMQALQHQLNAKADEQLRLRRAQAPAEKQNEVEREIRELSTRYDELLGEIRLRTPRRLALLHPEPISSADIRRLLDSDTVLLEYVLDDRQSTLWVVTSDKTTAHRLPDRTEIERRARAFYETASRRPATGDRNQFQVEAAELSRLLLGPAADRLDNKRIVIVPDGVLHYVPFAALPSPGTAESGKGRNHSQLTTRDPQLLVERSEVVVLPSAATLQVLRTETAGRVPPPNTLAVFADPVFSTEDARLGNSKSPAGAGAKSNLDSVLRSAEDVGTPRHGFGLPRLPYSRREAEGILKFVPPSKRLRALDFDADRANVLNGRLGSYKILHFATHGFLNTVHPELSGIALSLVDRRGNPLDGFLRANEICTLTLPVELVVLSACNSGLGKDVRGEGLIGLPRSFMYAGTPRVIVSLWRVDDLATSELMALFYEAMLGPQRLSPSAALRQAQATMRKRGRPPYFWAAFQLQGEWR